jgi:hypothetical protein
MSAGESLEELLIQHTVSQDSSSTTWLSDGCSESGLQQLTAGSCLPTVAGLEVAGEQEPGSCCDADSSTAKCVDTRGASAGQTGQSAAAGGSAAAASKSEASAVKQQGRAGAATAAAAQGVCVQGSKGSSGAMKGCMLVLWSTLLLAVGFLAAAVLVAMQDSHGPADRSEMVIGFDDFDVGVLASMARRYAV